MNKDTQATADIEVTMVGAFGSFVFRAAESDLASVIPAKLERAKLEAEVRSEVALIDAQQVALSEKFPRIAAKIAAAETLENTHEKEAAESERDALQSQVDALSEKRGRTLAVLE